MKKRPHKVLGIEKRPDNVVRVSDGQGGVHREELSWSALSAAQQASLDGHAKRRLGQTAK